MGLALSGGGGRGAAHAGVLRVLDRAGIAIHCIAGTSSGGVVGAFYAAGVPLDRQLAFAHRLRWRSVRLLGIPRMGFFHTGEMERMLVEVLGDIHFSDLRIPLAVVATDFRSARPVIFREGPVCPALAASGAIPIVFSPVLSGEMVLVDGGLSDNLPAELAREMGAEVVLGVNVVSEFNESRTFSNLFEIALATMDYAIRDSTEAGANRCDLCVRPQVEARGISDLKLAPAMMAQGEAAMLRALPRLESLLTED